MLSVSLSHSLSSSLSKKNPIKSNQKKKTTQHSPTHYAFDAIFNFWNSLSSVYWARACSVCISVIFYWIQQLISDHAAETDFENTPKQWTLRYDHYELLFFFPFVRLLWLGSIVCCWVAIANDGWTWSEGKCSKRNCCCEVFFFSLLSLYDLHTYRVYESSDIFKRIGKMIWIYFQSDRIVCFFVFFSFWLVAFFTLRYYNYFFFFFFLRTIINFNHIHMKLKIVRFNHETTFNH